MVQMYLLHVPLQIHFRQVGSHDGHAVVVTAELNAVQYLAAIAVGGVTAGCGIRCGSLPPGSCR